MADDLAEAVATVYEHLTATEELPLDPEANRWIAEAEAVVADLERGDPDPETVERRLATVLDLLSEVDSTGSSDADAHVAAARQRVRTALDRD
ncbi:hypothetical protein ACKVMT_01680 [Halobacteriales archaeon Cl-PHB]